MGIKAIIFDFDGTMVDSLGVWDKFIWPAFLNNIMPGNNITDFSIFHRLANFELSKYLDENYSLKLSPQFIASEILNLSKRLYMEQVSVKPGVVEFLKSIKKSGYKTGIATTCQKANVISYLESRNMIQYFDRILTQEDMLHGKPHPYIYLKTAEVLEVSPDECLVFEDTLEGVQAGKAAGMTVFGMYDRKHDSILDKIKILCDKYFISFDELINNIDSELVV